MTESATAAPTDQGVRRSEEDALAPARDPHLDAICRTAAALFGTPFSSVSVLDPARQHFVGREGFGNEGTLREIAFCAWTVQAQTRVPFIVQDTHLDPRFAEHPLVVGPPHLRFYAGVPLSLEAERYSATLCIADSRPRHDLGEAQVRQLRDMAVFVEAYLRLRADHDRRQREAEDLRVTLDSMDEGVLSTDADDRVRVHNRRVADLMGVPASLLYDGAPFAAVRAHQKTQGQFAGLPEPLRCWLEGGEAAMRPAEYERERPNGTAIQVRTRPMPGGGLVRTFTDVTARRATERALRESERRYRLIAENASDIPRGNQPNPPRARGRAPPTARPSISRQTATGHTPWVITSGRHMASLYQIMVMMTSQM